MSLYLSRGNVAKINRERDKVQSRPRDGRDVKQRALGYLSLYFYRMYIKIKYAAVIWTKLLFKESNSHISFGFCLKYHDFFKYGT